MVIFSLRDVHGGLQFGFKDGGQVIVPVVLEFTVHCVYQKSLLVE